MAPDNDNSKTPVVLDEHRGMAAQKATDQRRHATEVEADQEALRLGQAELEKVLFAAPAATWQEAVERASFLLRRFGETSDGQDPRYKQMIADVMEDFRRLTARSANIGPF